METIEEIVNDNGKPQRRRSASTAELYTVLEALLPFARIEIECLADYVANFPDDPDHAEDAVRVQVGKEAIESAGRLIVRKSGVIRRMPNLVKFREDPDAMLVKAAPGGIPAIVAEAGEQAVEQYRAYFDTVLRTQSTRASYRVGIQRFFRWAESRGLRLERIAATDVAAYAEELGGVTAASSAEQYLTALRSLFRHLVSAGVIPQNPCLVGLTSW